VPSDPRRPKPARPGVAGVVLGATFTGRGVQELLHSATIAAAGQVPMAVLEHAVPPFPTVSEVWLRLLEAYRVRTAARNATTPEGTSLP
jgi:hypothetical protein